MRNYSFFSLCSSLFQASLQYLSQVINTLRQVLFFITTGVFYIASSQFLTDLITNGYSVQFSNCAVSSDVYKVGLGLYSLNMNFNNVTLMFDLQVSSTSVTGFNITFSTTMATFISLMKVCYIVKNPSYTDVFYV